MPVTPRGLLEGPLAELMKSLSVKYGVGMFALMDLAQAAFALGVASVREADAPNWEAIAGSNLIEADGLHERAKEAEVKLAAAEATITALTHERELAEQKLQDTTEAFQRQWGPLSAERDVLVIRAEAAEAHVIALTAKLSEQATILKHVTQAKKDADARLIEVAAALGYPAEICDAPCNALAHNAKTLTESYLDQATRLAQVTAEHRELQALLTAERTRTARLETELDTTKDLLRRQTQERRNE